jgi:hypothetical protein
VSDVVVKVAFLMTPEMEQLVSAVESDGYAVARAVVEPALLNELRSLVSELPTTSGQVRRQGASVYGIRHLLHANPRLRDVVGGAPFVHLARAVLGEAARPVKGVFFDKTADANWPVPWHQDVTITVRERCDVAGFEMRPVNDGFVHVLPPVAISERLLALRIHLDDAGAEHGTLRVITGTHRQGRLDAFQVSECVGNLREKVVPVAAGDVMLMRPLLLHASSPCRLPDHRRVVHVEFAAFDLPGGLQWAG